MIIIKKIIGIYVIRNKVNNKVYVGQSSDVYHRIATHKSTLKNNKHCNKHLQNEWNEFGSKNYEFVILFECNKEELSKMEVETIAKYKANDSCYGYNLTSGGDDSYSVSEDLVEIRRNAIKKLYEEEPERKEQSRQRAVKQFQDPEFYRKYRELRSSEEYRKRISESHKGQNVSKQAREAYIEKYRKPVICVETGAIYPSTRIASSSLPGNKNIVPALTGKRKTVGGYHWRYATREEEAQQREG